LKPRFSKIDPFGSLIEAGSHDDDVRELDVDTLKEIYRRDQLLLLRGFKSLEGAEDFLEFCESWGPVHVWPFGKVLEIVEHPNPLDHIFDHSFVPLHWDGMFAPQIPEYQIFQCVSASSPGQGGQTNFSNTKLALELATDEQRESWSKVVGTYLRKIAIIDRKAVSPIVDKHPYRDFSVMRYYEDPSLRNERFINPTEVELSGLELEELKRVRCEITEMLYDRRCLFSHSWKPGDILIADNLSLLHGRESFAGKSPRHLRRISVSGHSHIKNKNLVY
jgi:alpha-ketoglutarate-dependent taurine dioxygenase